MGPSHCILQQLNSSVASVTHTLHGTAMYADQSPWDCHVCRSVGVVLGVCNVGIYLAYMEMECLAMSPCKSLRHVPKCPSRGSSQRFPERKSMINTWHAGTCRGDMHRDVVDTSSIPLKRPLQWLELEMHTGQRKGPVSLEPKDLSPFQEIKIWLWSPPCS